VLLISVILSFFLVCLCFFFIFFFSRKFVYSKKSGTSAPGTPVPCNVSSGSGSGTGNSSSPGSDSDPKKKNDKKESGFFNSYWKVVFFVGFGLSFCLIFGIFLGYWYFFHQSTQTPIFMDLLGRIISPELVVNGVPLEGQYAPFSFWEQVIRQYLPGDVGELLIQIYSPNRNTLVMSGEEGVRLIRRFGGQI